MKRRKSMKKVLSLLLASALTFGCLPGIAEAAEGTKPADGVTYNQPFQAGTGGSDNFRIPCLVTLDDGTIVAGCDARWTWAADAGGIDTIVSRSTDNGATWNYTFANYLGDNGNVANRNSTAFIDPAMATDGKNVYMIADLYPAGYAINSAAHTAVNGDGFDANGNVRLSNNGRSSYDYYLEKVEGAQDNAEAYYQIKSNATNEAVAGYTVDALFNIKGNGKDTNLFCEDSPFELLPTDYLYFTKSSDGGATWSVPYLINLKYTEEQCLLVGPGRGLYTSTGRLIFTVYDFSWADKESAVIYSDDGGKTWERGADVTAQTSEATVVEADGRLYMFTRHGGYWVSEDWGETWSSRIMPDISYISSCQLSAVTYSKKIDGKTAILLSAPSSTSSRSAGKIFVGLVQEDKSIDWAYEYSVNGSAYYAYSCLSELKDGSMGLLYESAGSAITYKSIAIEDIARGASIGSLWCTDSEGNDVKSLSMKPSDSVAVTVNGEIDNVTVSSDKAEVKAAYADGTLTITADASVEGLVQAVVTVKNGTDTVKIPVSVSASEKYEVVNLRMGDTKTYRAAGDYADAELEGLNTEIATVQLESDGLDNTEKLQAQLATAEGNFNGSMMNVDDCQYTFAGTSNANQYTVSAQTADGTTVYLHPRDGANVPNKTASSVISVEKRQSDGKFTLLDTTSGNMGNGGYLWFWNNDATKLRYDRNSTVAENCYFELYEKSAEAPADSPIQGYVKATEVKAGGKYLIATRANNQNYYILRPTASNSEAVKYEHVAKVTDQFAASKGRELLAQLATSTARFDGEKVNVKDCLYTFAGTSTANQYTIFSHTAEGTTVYLHHKGASAAGYPNQTTGAEIAVTASNGKFAFEDKGAGSAGKYLYFHNTNTANLFYDRQGGLDNNTYFELYEESALAPADSKIPGYRKLSALSEVKAGGRYLIATTAADGGCYIMHPTTGTEKFNHVAKVTNEYYEPTATTEITITGVKEGKTSVTIGDTTYYIIVKNDVKNLTLKIDETYLANGELQQAEDGQKVVSLTEKAAFAPYEKQASVEDGYYLIGNGNYIMNNSVLGGTPNGLGLESANFESGNHVAKLWKVEKADGGYTFQDGNGKYVHIDGQDVTLSDEAQALTVGVKNAANKTFGISAGGYYLNNWAETNTKVAGWNANNNDWSFYKPTTNGLLITAEKAGNVKVVIGGTTYNISVERDADAEYIIKVEGTEVARGAYNTPVTVTAPEAPEGQVFAGWQCEGKIVSLDSVYKFFIPNDMDLTPLYVPAEEKQPEAKAVISNALAMARTEDTKSDIRFVGQLTVPKGYTLENAGLIWSTKPAGDVSLIAGGKLNSNLQPTYITKISTTNQFSVTIKGLPKGMFIRGAIFAEFTDTEGNTVFVYSDEQQVNALK